MARYTGPVCRLCRREGMKLFLKGTKCFSDKCPIEKRNFAPGQHGKDRKAKIVGYGLQLREKQKAKRMYFTQEGQFRNYFEKASRAQGRYRRNAPAAAGASSGQRRLPSRLRHIPPPGAPAGASRPRSRRTDARSTFLRTRCSVGEEIAIRESSNKLPILEQCEGIRQPPERADLAGDRSRRITRAASSRCRSAKRSSCRSTSS